MTGADLLALKNGVVAAAAGGEGDYAVIAGVLNLVKRKRVDVALEAAPQHFDAGELRQAGFFAVVCKGLGFSCKQLKEAGFSCKQLKDECGFSLAQLKEGGFTAQEVGAIMAFFIPDIIAAYNLKKGHQFVLSDPSCKVGQVVFAEGKVGVITLASGNICKISYSDGSRNKNMRDGHLQFATSYSDPVERVWAME